MKFKNLPSILICCITLLTVGCSESFVYKTEHDVEEFIENPTTLETCWYNISNQWQYFENKFIEPSTFYVDEMIPLNQINEEPDEIIVIPHYWQNAKQCATYHKRILNLTPNSRYAIFLYDKFSTAGQVFCNGKKVYLEGIPSSDWTKTVAGRNMNITYLTSDNRGVIDIVLQCSNKIYRNGGLYFNIKIASQKYVELWFVRMLILRLIFIGALLLIFLYQMALFINNHKKLNLYLSLFSLFALLRLSFSRFSAVSALFPSIPYSISLKIEIIPLYMCATLYSLYINSYNGFSEKRKSLLILLCCSGVCFATTIFLPLSIVNYLVPGYEIFMIIGSFYGIYLCFTRKINNKYKLNFFDLTGLISMFIGMLHDILVLYGVGLFMADTDLIMYGFAIFVVLQSVNTAWRQTRLHDNLRKLSQLTEQINTSANRFISQNFLELLGKTDICTVSNKDHIKMKVALLSADVRNFTVISEKLEPNDVFNMLNIYMDYVTPIIRYYGGFIAKVMGDGITAVFANGADRALLAALEMQEAMVMLQSLLEEANLPTVVIGTGVHYGDVILGILGNDDRLSNVLVSPVVDEVSCIESANKIYHESVIASEEAVNAINEKGIFSIKLIREKKETPCNEYRGCLYAIEKSVELSD